MGFRGNSDGTLVKPGNPQRMSSAPERKSQDLEYQEWSSHHLLIIRNIWLT